MLFNPPVKKSFKLISVLLSYLLVFTFIPWTHIAKAESSENYQFVKMWPELPQPWYFNSPQDVAVDSSGNVYVADTNNECIKKFDSSGTFIAKWGGPGTGNGQFDGPTSIATDASGNVYVADEGNFRIQKFDSSGTFVSKWGSLGSGNGQFNWPSGIAVDSSGNVYVADAFNDRIQKFDSSGSFVAKWGSPGTGNGRFNYPDGIAIDSSDNIYVADTGNDRIQQFSSTGTFVAKWGSYGSGDGQFNYPDGIAVDSSGTVYVADAFNYRIQTFDSSGTFVDKWGGYGSGDGQFDGPTGIATDASGNVYVADAGNDRIQSFDSSGAFVSKWGSSDSGDGQFNYPDGVTVDSSGTVYVADISNHRIQTFDSSGTFITKWGGYGLGDGQFDYPTGVAVDSSGTVYVADANNYRIQTFDSSGTFITKWGGYGAGDGQFNQATGIAVDSSGTVYVADTENDRIQKFSSSGTFIAKWGSPGSGDGQFDWPDSIAIDSSGNVYVSDTKNDRIQKFSSSGTFIAKWGSSGSGDGQFDEPRGLAIDSSGNVYVADAGNDRIQKFTRAVYTALSTNPAVANGDNDWYKTNPSIALTPDVTATTYYSWDGTSSPTTYTVPINVPSDGVHNLYYFSIDVSNNTETINTKEFKLDTGVPDDPDTFYSPSHTPSTTASADRTVEVEFSGAADTVSGVAGYITSWSRDATETPASSTVDAADTGDVTQTVTSPELDDGAWWLNLSTKDSAGNRTNTAHFGPFNVDTLGPTGSVVVNSGAAITNNTALTLNLSASDSGSGVDTMRFKNSGGAWSAWEAYNPAKAWALPGSDGNRAVYAQFKDTAGNISSTVSDSIFLDTLSPTAKIKAPKFSTNVSKNRKFKVKWSGADAAPSSGIAAYDVQYKINKGGSWRFWKTNTTRTSAKFKGKSGKTYYFRARAHDKAGNTGYFSSKKKTIVPFDNNSLIAGRKGFSNTLKKSKSKYYLSTVRYAKKKGEAITYKFKGNSVFLIGTKGKGYSKAQIYIDGKRIKKVNAHSKKKHFRKVLFSKSFRKIRTHKIKIVKLSKTRRFDVDGLGVGR